MKAKMDTDIWQNAYEIQFNSLGLN